MTPHELRTIAVLQALDDAALARLATVLEEREYAEGQTIFGEGDPGDGMYFIVSGTVHIQKRTSVETSIHKTLAILEPGDYFGEMALLDQQPRSAAAVAASRTRALRLSHASFDRLTQEGGRAGVSVLFAMIRTSGDRIRRLNAQVIVYDEIGKAIGESGKVEQLLDVVLRQLSQATLADWGLAVLRAQFSERLEVRGAVHLQLTPAQQEAIAAGQGFLAPVLQDPRDYLVHDFGREEPFKALARLGFEHPSLLLAPIRIEHQVLGLLALGGQQPGQFDLNDLNLMRGVARQVAQAILNARHREDELARARHAKQFVRF